MEQNEAGYTRYVFCLCDKMHFVALGKAAVPPCFSFLPSKKSKGSSTTLFYFRPPLANLMIHFGHGNVS